MRWIVGVVVISGVAPKASRGQGSVVVVHVAGCARYCDMRTRQWERRIVVIERRRAPCRSGMTNRAIRRESRRDVIWIRGAVVVLHVATGAYCRKRRVVIVDVTTCARCSYMRSCQRKRGVVVIERRRTPCRRRVTNRGTSNHDLASGMYSGSTS